MAGAGCSSVGVAPPLDEEQHGELTAKAIAAACEEICNSKPLYIRDQLIGIGTVVGEEEPMPAEVTQAIRGAYPAATFVDQDAQDRVSDELLAGRAVLVSVADVAHLASGVIGVEVGVSSESFLSQTVQFLWNGSNWVIADSDDTGITVTTSVS